LLRAALFALATFMLLALAELLFERASQRSSIHEKAVQATDLALPSIQLAVWSFDEPGLRLLADSLLRDSSITRVQVKTPDGTMDLDLRRQDHAMDGGDSQSWSRPLHSQDERGLIGTLTVSESLRQVDMETWRRAAYRIPVELLKVLGIVIGMTILTHVHVVSRLTSLAAQLRSFRADDSSQRVTDIGRRSYGDDEIASLAQSINELLQQRSGLRDTEIARERAESASRAKSELLSRISHELRTPLNAMLGFTQALQGDPEVVADPARAERIKLMVKAGRHLAALIADLLDLSSIECGGVVVAIQPVELHGVCVDALALVACDAEAAGISLSLALQDDAAWVAADPIRLEQVLLNLLSNGVKYNQLGGHVRLSSRLEADGRIALVIEDDGIGMSTQQLASLFQPFNRLGRQASRTPGTGIGLVITAKLVELMGGQMEVTSVPEQGTRFVVRLPARAPASLAGAEHGPGPRAAAPYLQPMIVVYIEDDPVNVEVMRALLSPRPSARLEVASSVAGGMDLIVRVQPDLVLLDMQLSGEEGLSLLRQLRATARFARLPVIVVSADTSDETQRAALAAGADAYLSKPYDFASFLETIDALMEKGAPRG
jgi:signal transduction histidine kinase/ActR/RegA family two-component response regulator